MLKKKRDKKIGKSILRMLKTLALAIVLAFLIRNFVFKTTVVVGASMEPTLHEKDRLISYVLPLYLEEPQRDDIVIIDAPNGSGKKYVKRLIGLPGDEIEIKNGRVFINGVEKEEDYIHHQVLTEFHSQNHWKLREGEFFVLGDNRNPGISVDSRIFGPVEREHINSIVGLRYFPFNRFTKF